MKTFIYALYDPRKPRIMRYVGKANDVEKRLYGHIRDAVKYPNRRTHKLDWIRSLLRENILPKTKVLEQVVEKRWERRERYWIKKLKQQNHSLTNGTDGGDGGCMGPSALKKISDALYGRKRGPHSIEHRRKIGDASRGRRHSVECRRRIGDTQRGKIRGPHSIEHRRKLGDAHRGKIRGPFSAERRRKLSEAKRGKQFSDVHRRKISDGLRLMWKHRKEMR